jgi:hypothetical protein
MLHLREIDKPLRVISLIGLLLLFLFILILIFKLLLNLLTNISLLQLPVFPLHFERFLSDVFLPLFLFILHIILHVMKLQSDLILQMDTPFGIQSQIIQILIFLLNDFFQGLNLKIITDGFLLNFFEQLFVFLPDALGLVVLDHHIVKLVLEHTNPLMVFPWVLSGDLDLIELVKLVL